MHVMWTTPKSLQLYNLLRLCTCYAAISAAAPSMSVTLSKKTVCDIPRSRTKQPNTMFAKQQCTNVALIWCVVFCLRD